MKSERDRKLPEGVIEVDGARVSPEPDPSKNVDIITDAAHGIGEELEQVDREADQADQQSNQEKDAA